MKLFLFAILIQLTSASIHYHDAVGVPEATRIKQRESVLNTRIINGNPVFLGQYPYFGGLIILLTSGSVSVCGSTLISSTKLITAAHCWNDGLDQAEIFEVVLGSTTLFSGGARITTKQVITHSEYNPANVRNDIAIITIQEITSNAFIQPIKLNQEDVTASTLAEVVGFGRISDEDEININQYLSSTQVFVIENRLCVLLYGQFFTMSMICTDGINGSPCGGDSGGPLLYKNEASEAVMIGVISYGSPYGCGVGHPAVYTKITDYIDWIEARL